MHDDSVANDTKLYKNSNLQILFAVTLVSLMGVASLTPAFPGISRAFNISPKEVGLLITLFTMPGILLTPVFGILADRYGRKRILVPSLFLFGIAGTLCFFARDFNILMVFRFLQGVGAASLGVLNFTIIGDLFKGNNRSAAMGLNAAVISIATAIFPLIGGGLATFAWYYPFLLPSFAVIVGFLVLFGLKNPEPKNKQSLSKYLSETFESIKNLQIIGILLISVLTFVILYGPYLSYLPFIIEDTFGMPPYIIGIIMSFASIASFTTSMKIGYLSKRYCKKSLILTSSIFYIASMLPIPFIHNVWLLIIPSIFFGIAQGINIPSILSLIASLSPMNQRAAIMSVIGMAFRLGQTLGPLIIVPVYGIWGINGAYNLGVVAAALMLITALVTLKKNIATA